MTAHLGYRQAGQGQACLSLVEFDVCWELLDLGRTPPTLELQSPGRTWPERHQITTTTLEALRRRDLANQTGPIGSLTGMLRLLAHPHCQLDLRLESQDGDQLTTIGAQRDGQGVVLTRRAGEISLRAITAPRLVGEVVDTLGPIAPGSGPTVNLPADVVDAAWHGAPDRSLWTFADNLVELGVPQRDARNCVGLCHDIRAFGEVGTVFYLDQAVHFGPWVVAFHVRDSGYYLRLRRNGTITIGPLDADRLTRHIAELLTEGAPRGSNPRRVSRSSPLSRPPRADENGAVVR